MPYQVPPVFSSGNVLTAAQLNIISENLEFFWSLVSGVNIPFSGQTLTASGDSRVWTFRNVARYLHYKVLLDVGTSDEFELYVNGNREVYDASNHNADYTFEGYVDLTAITSPPSVGQFYDVYVTETFSGSPNELQIIYLIESDSTTL
jgi:hypothetical protein